MSLSFSRMDTVMVFAPPEGSRNTRLALMVFARFAAATNSRMSAMATLDWKHPSATNSQTSPQTRLPRLNFVLVSTLATLRSGMVFVSAPNGIRPNRVFGLLYWMRVELAAMLVLSQKMTTLGLKRSPMTLLSPGAKVNSVMVCCVSAILSLLGLVCRGEGRVRIPVRVRVVRAGCGGPRGRFPGTSPSWLDGDGNARTDGRTFRHPIHTVHRRYSYGGIKGPCAHRR